MLGRQKRPRLGRGAHAGTLFARHGEEGVTGRARVDHRAAHEIGRGAGHGEQRGGDETAGRRFRDADGFLAGLQFFADALGEREQGVHGVNPSS